MEKRITPPPIGLARVGRASQSREAAPVKTSPMAGSVKGAAARAAFFIATPILLQRALLGPQLEAYSNWTPWAFLLGLTITGTIVQRYLRLTPPPWTSAISSSNQPTYADYVPLWILAAIPGMFGFVYVVHSGLFEVSYTLDLGSSGILLGWLLYVVAAPVVEEYYFRFLLHRELACLFRNPLFVAFANAVWFASVHAPYAIPLALVTGFCCTALRMKTGAMVWPVTTHCIANLVLQVVQP